MTVSAPLSICGITINDDFTNFLEEGSKICTKFALIPLGPSHRDWLYQVLGKSVQNWTRNTYVTKPLGEFRMNVILRIDYPQLVKYEVSKDSPLPSGESIESINKEAYPKDYHGPRDT